MTKPTHLAGGAMFDLSAVELEVRKEDAFLRDGHTARTLVRESDLRVLLIVMRAGARITEHRAENTASVHALRGRLRLRLPDSAADVPSGSLLILEKGLRHDVEALEDSAFLLTIGWRGS